VFNGGPGAASLWIHVGVLGPRRVAFDDAVHPPTVGPFRTRDNPLSPLDVTDLVFIDPVGTGFSHLTGAGKPEEFYGVDEDAKATAEFIVAWLTQNRRWSSPKFVLGESYGTTRICVLAKALGGGPMGGGTLPGVTLNGAILLGSSVGNPGADPAAQALLPTLAATAWYHGKIDNKQNLASVVSAASQFAATDYGAALFAGNALPQSARQAIAQRISVLTGLSEHFVLEQNLRISAGAFANELLRDRGLQVGHYDGRYSLPRAGDGDDPVADDPAMGQYTPGFVAGFHDYLRNELGVSLPQNYQVIAFADVNFKWNWGARGTEANYAEDLAAAMRRNPAMRLLVGSGYYDLVTPFMLAQYMMTHAAIATERLSFKNYEAGHMVYLGEQPAREFAHDLREFIGAASH
jgi:carboxypeptidase C (cathepsin A)